MERRELHHDRHAVSLLTDHIVFSPKYREKIPVEKTIALAVEGIIRKICKEMKIEIIDMAMKNHEKPNAKTLCTGLGLKSEHRDFYANCCIPNKRYIKAEI
jgi:hypothetical protein